MRLIAAILFMAVAARHASSHPILDLTGAASPSVICPDGESQCSSGSTCCMSVTRNYGCCPLENAVCCSDDKHCCPNGYQCDDSTGTCSRADSVLPMILKRRTMDTEPENKKCPDNKAECPDSNTCCMVGSSYGCCPISGAYCCPDQEHCCPGGYTCQASDGTCKKNNSVVSMFLKVSVSTPAAVTCPDRKSYCEEGVCCPIKSNGTRYGCCPYDGGKCCSDMIHCCPADFACTANAQCVKPGEESIAFAEIQPVNEVPNVVECADGRSECPDGNTCCMLASGQYGCCPLPNADCCSDQVHCCPSGYNCNTDGTCTNEDSVVPMVLKQPATLKTEPQNVICPNGQSQCPDGNTCCRVGNNEFGCCPMVAAVCCSDQKHCCPKGFLCDTSTNKCSKGDLVIPVFVKQPAVETSPNIMCPDGSSVCPDKNTCCMLSDGKYGCCPLADASCCDDGVHCCPQGYTCMTDEGTCTREDSVIPLLTKQPAMEFKPENVVCPDGQSQCPDGNTCCLLQSNQYGCCPKPDATCCSDKIHCCPHGYQCSNGACVQANAVDVLLERLRDTRLL